MQVARTLAAMLLCGALATPAAAFRCQNPQPPEALGIDLSLQDRCDPLVPERCLLPMPSDHFTVRDRSTRTGRRVAFVRDAFPMNTSGVHVDPTEWSSLDGFSPGSAILLWMPGVDLGRSGAPRLTDIGRSLEIDSPIVVLDARTRERWPVWAELDVNAPPENRALIVRPARNFLEGRRYVVAVRGLVDDAGTALAPSPAFAAYRDRACTTDAAFETRRKTMEKNFRTLARAGVVRDDLQLAFEFTVASADALAGRMLRMRDDAFRALGRRAPAFAITEVQEQPNAETLRRIRGTFEVPLYLTGAGGPGERLALDAKGRPQRRETPYTATFTCNVPPAAATTPARMSLYGHGLLGDQSEVNGRLVRSMSATYNVAYCATDWIGMAEEDVGNAVAILNDLSRFPSFPDRLQQGFLNFLFLGRLMRHPDGFVADAAFQVGGRPLLDVEELYFDGNSQGAILGGAPCAVATDFRRCVLGEAGMNYSMLLQRSVDFDLYKLILDQTYPDPFVQLLGINLIQMLWDRGETNGYAQHVTADPYPRTPKHTVLLLGAVGDHQVSQFGLQAEARTMQAAAHLPLVGPGREVGGENDWGLTPIPRYPFDGSAYFLWDTGAVLSPLDNVPPREGHDPHDDTPQIPAVQALKDAFWRPDGVVLDVCTGAPCTGPQF